MGRDDLQTLIYGANKYGYVSEMFEYCVLFATCQLICIRCLLEVVCEGLNERPVSSHS